MGYGEIIVVADPEARLEQKGALTVFRDPSLAQLALWVDDGAGDSYDCIALDLLRALGKAKDSAGRAAHAQRRFDQACAWLMAHETRDIIAASAHRLKRRSLAALIEAAGCSRARLWLAAAPGTTQLALLLRDWPHRRCSVEQLIERLAREHTTSPVAGRSRDLPAALQTPHDEFPTFVSTARAVLTDGQQRANFDRLYNRTCATTVNWYVELDDRRPTEETLASFLRQLVNQHRSQFAAVTALRAAQCTLLVLGIGVKVDLRKFLFTRADTPVGLDESEAHIIQTYASGRHAALACLQRICDLAPQTILGLPVSAVDRARHRLMHDGIDVAIPEVARPSIYAQLAERLLACAAPDDPLFNARTGKPLTLPGYRRTIEAVARETGLRLSGPWNERTPRDSTRWNQRRGISVFSLAN